MNTKKAAVSVLAMVLFCLGFQPAQAGSNISFSGTYADSLHNDIPDGMSSVVTAASVTFNLTVPLTSEILPGPLNGSDTWDTNTELDINITVGSGAGQVTLSDTLGEDPHFHAGKTNATIHGTNFGPVNPMFYTLAVSWTASTLTINGSSTNDLFGWESIYGTPGMPGTTKFTDIYDVSVDLGDFSYDNPYVFVTGTNTDREVNGLDMSYSLENGHVSGAADFTPPTLHISSPGVTARTTTGLLTITGNAADNVGVAGVFCTVNGDTANTIQISGPYDVNLKSASVDFTNDFSQSSDFLPGTNILQFYATDISSNVSAVVTSRVFWVQPATMVSVSTGAGSGSISGLSAGQAVNIGEGYPVTAHPGRGYILESWVDSQSNLLSSSPSFNYAAESDGTLIANFVPNPYPALKGSYTGLFFDPFNGVTPTNAGYLTLTLTTNGSYSGNVYLGTNKYPFAGQFQFPADFFQGDTATNTAEVVVNLSSQTALNIQLLLDMDTNLTDAGAGFLAGTVTATNSVLEINYWVASLTAELSRFSTNLAAPGLYNIQIPSLSDDPSVAPGGISYGSATLSAQGGVQLFLNLADGSSPAVSFNSAVARDGTFPFFKPLYGGKGVILGWLQFTNDTTTPADVEGTNIAWVKLPVADRFYTNGFSAQGTTLATGSKFATNKTVANIGGGTNVQVVLSDGKIAVNAILAYNPQRNTFTAQSPNSNSVTLTMAAATGVLSGSFVPANGARAISFNGAFLPDAGAGCGFFAGTNQDTGSFTLNGINATNNLSFMENYADKLVNDPVNGYVVETTASGNIQMTLPLNGVDITTFNATTAVSVNAGGSGGSGLAWNNVLGDDTNYQTGKTSATIHSTDANGSNYTLALRWTATTLTVNGSFGYDLFGADSLYGTPGTPGLTPISDVYSVSLQVGDFSTNDSLVFVTGRNTDTEIVGPDGNPYSLESGNIRGAADFTPPTAVISTPAGNFQTTNGIIPLLSGQASDNVALSSVYLVVNYDMNDPIALAGPFDPMMSLKSAGWGLTNLDLSTLALPGSYGTNTLQVYATDSSGNVSSPATRNVLWAHPVILNLPTTNQYGTVTGLRNGQTVNVGEGYAVTANPATNHGYVFENWTDSQGNVLSVTPSFNFMPGLDGTLIANFVTNPYVALKGNYTGLFYDMVNGVAPASAGYVTVSVTALGACSAKFYLGTSNFTVNGPFLFPYDVAQGDSNNFANFSVNLNSNTTLYITLLLNMDTNLADPGAGVITGSIYANGYDSYQIMPMPGWTATLSAELSKYVSSTNTTPGLYNLAIAPLGSDPSQAPGGYGYGSATLSASGAVNLVLNLADGSPTVSFNSAVAQDGTFPFFNPLYGGKGIILGWLQFTNDPANLADVEGANVAWVKLPAAGRFYTNGFSSLPTGSTPFDTFTPGFAFPVTGSRYVAPRAGTNILASATNNAGSPNLPVVLNDLNGASVNTADFSAIASYNPQRNTLTVHTPNQNALSLALATNTGVLSGSFVAVPGRSATTIHFNAALLPKAGAIYGFFAGTNQDTGVFTLAMPTNIVPVGPPPFTGAATYFGFVLETVGPPPVGSVPVTGGQ